MMLVEPKHVQTSSHTHNLPLIGWTGRKWQFEQKEEAVECVTTQSARLIWVVTECKPSACFRLRPLTEAQVDVIPLFLAMCLLSVAPFPDECHYCFHLQIQPLFFNLFALSHWPQVLCNH